MAVSRRNFLSIVTAAAPLAVVSAARPAHAWTQISASDAGIEPAQGLWKTLIHATDGTDPSTTITTELPRFNSEIRALDGKTVSLEGYLQPCSSGFGKTDYVVSQLPFHCPFCYIGGRASLALATPETAGSVHTLSPKTKVKVTGVLALQETKPDDFYYSIRNAKITVA